MKPIAPILVAALAAFTAHAQSPQHHHHEPPARSPYAGEESREIKALSADEQRAWLEGRGAGLARAAELNRQPGPQHVLELASQLGLTPEQEARSRRLMDRHKAEARALGQQLVDAERRLDGLFRRGDRPDAVEVARLAESIGVLAGRIRASHLLAHIEQGALLTKEQVSLYQRLRGYSN